MSVVIIVGLLLIIGFELMHIKTQNEIIEIQNEVMKKAANSLDTCNAEADKYFSRDVINSANNYKQ